MAKQSSFFKKTYRRGMVWLLLVTGITVGSRMVWEWLTPKPEPKLSAQLTREYFDRFSHLGITAIKKDSRDFDIEIDREGNDALKINSTYCEVPSTPAGNPWPPAFNVEREGRMLNAYGDIDKDNFTLLEYHEAVVSCLNAALTEAARAEKARASWRPH